MIFILLSILASTALMVMFKLFERFGVNLYHGIIVNYFVCTICAVSLTDFDAVPTQNLASTPWFWLALLLGSLFIMLFLLIGKTTQQVGVSVASISMKLALVFPVLTAILIYNEPFNWFKILGFTLAIPAVVFASMKSSEANEEGFQMKQLLFPLIILVGSGLCDCIIQYVERSYFSNGGYEVFTMMLFLVAGVSGLPKVVWQWKTVPMSWKSVVGGVILGVFNYGSIYFLFKSLNTKILDSGTLFAFNNLAIVVASTLISIAFFSERLSKMNWFGMALCAVSLVILMQ